MADQNQNAVTTLDNVAVAPSPMQIISSAVERGADIDVLEKMFNLYERDQARLAAMAFAQPGRKTSQTGRRSTRFRTAPGR